MGAALEVSHVVPALPASVPESAHLGQVLSGDNLKVKPSPPLLTSRAPSSAVSSFLGSQTEASAPRTDYKLSIMVGRNLSVGVCCAS